MPKTGDFMNKSIYEKLNGYSMNLATSNIYTLVQMLESKREELEAAKKGLKYFQKRLYEELNKLARD